MVKTQLCTFILDKYFFGLEIQRVQEVIRWHDMTNVPLAPPVVKGLINLRGQIVLALDLRLRLGMPEYKSSTASMNVVLVTDDGPVSLLVDKIYDIMEVSDDQFEHPPETLRKEAKALIKGAYKLPERLLLLLDVDRILDIAI
jgi:purine-binding chemotaxis protein CheW